MNQIILLLLWWRIIEHLFVWGIVGHVELTISIEFGKLLHYFDADIAEDAVLKVFDEPELVGIYA